DGAGRGIDEARELDQHAIAGGLDDAAAVPGDRRVDELDPMRPEPGQGAGFVELHQPAVAHHVAGENRHQPALDTNLVHDSPVPVAVTSAHIPAAGICTADARVLRLRTPCVKRGRARAIAPGSTADAKETSDG